MKTKLGYPFRVYQRDPEHIRKHYSTAQKRWKLLAWFVWKTDAIEYAEQKFCADTQEIKIMHCNRNFKVYK